MRMQSQTQAGEPAHRPGDLLPPAIAAAGSQHGFGPEATQTLWDALILDNGAMAQFSHAEFGGSGQWMRGGMLMIGDMLNRELAARVGALCEDLSHWLAEHPESIASSGAVGHARAAQW